MNHCCTVSIARVYEAQGCLERAVWVYRRLLEKDPQREDWRHAVERLECKITNRPRRRAEDLQPLMCRLVDLALCCRRVISARKINSLFLQTQSPNSDKR